MDSKKFYRERKATEEALSVFFDKQSERDRVRKMVDRGYNRKDLMMFWADMAKVILRYTTLDDHFTIIFSYHFMILSHFRRDSRISLPFYLLSSLEHSLANHVKNNENPILQRV